MRLAEVTELSGAYRERLAGFQSFRSDERISSLDWPDDVLEQFLYDHASYEPFLCDYGHIDLSAVVWTLDEIPVEEFMRMPTGASDGDCIEEFAAAPDHWVAVRNAGVHVGVAECWERRGTWKRSPILIDRMLLDPPGRGLQVVEGRTRVGVLRGRHRQGSVVAERHLAWVGRSAT
ncbi:hypothetical protein ACSNOI_25845 [Actinomadura kijaniata]|uniref:hypothetical protein n=1 Tax=Actinomadura kijaniata TaxID=46161 RepID=UPI003F1E027A